MEAEGGEMMEHETILKMIEEVDPNDTAKLDEIDARVDCLIRNRTFIRFYQSEIGNRCYNYTGFDNFEAIGILSLYYTRSRDALKSIRPEKWLIDINTGFGKRGEHTYSCRLDLFKYPDDFINLPSPDLPTEELAELHAIIQAIAYERNKNDPQTI